MSVAVAGQRVFAAALRTQGTYASYRAMSLLATSRVATGSTTLLARTAPNTPGSTSFLRFVGVRLFGSKSDDKGVKGEKNQDDDSSDSDPELPPLIPLKPPRRSRKSKPVARAEKDVEKENDEKDKEKEHEKEVEKEQEKEVGKLPDGEETVFVVVPDTTGGLKDETASEHDDEQTPAAGEEEKLSDDEASTEEQGGEEAVESKGESDALVVEKNFWPDEVMVLPLVQRPVLPDTGMPVLMADEKLLSIIQNNFNRGRKYVGLFFVREEFRNKDKTPNITDLSQIHQIGTLAQVIDLKRDLSGHGFVHVFGLHRIRVRNVVPNRPVLTTKIDLVQNKMPHPKRAEYVKAYVYEILKVLTDLIKNQPLHRDFLIYLRQHMDDNPSRTADFAAASTTASGNEIQDILDCVDVDERLAKSLILLKKELELSNFQRSVAKQIEEKLSTQQRTFMLQEQLKLIKKELGLEKDEKEQFLAKFNERIEKVNPPPHARAVITQEMEKLSSLEVSSSEFNVTRNYLEWLTSLPWSKTSTDSYDLPRAGRILDEDHYGLDDVKMRIKEFIAVGKLLGSIQGKILCLVGPPGVGKTSIGKSIARSIDREFFRFSVGGLSDVAEIKGHRRTYVGAMPGKLIQSLKATQTSNPVIMIDEIDKLSKGYQGDPASALLEVLDPEQNQNFLDHYLDVRYDLSQVLFVCTANMLETIPKPLLDRMEVIRLSGYVLEEKVAIATNYLIPAAIKEAGLKKSQISITPSALADMIRSYCRESGVRNLKQQIEKIARKAAFNIATKQATKVVVTSENLSELLGKPVFTSDRFYDVPPVGVVMGLAWTSMGGASLYVETVALPAEGKGRLQTTGQMGDVMKEGTSVCYTFAKRYISQLDPTNEFFQKSDLHMHIPEGATPKDGPSAGVTMVTSLVSLALNKPCRSDVTMTGEITLTGKVLRIGGVREKIIAAKRAHVSHVLLPAENQRDFDELPDFIKQGVMVHYAATYDDVYRVAFAEDLPTVEAPVLPAHLEQTTVAEDEDQVTDTPDASNKPAVESQNTGDIGVDSVKDVEDERKERD